MTPEDDVTRPALYVQNKPQKVTSAPSAHEMTSDDVIGLDGRALRKIPVKGSALQRLVLRDLDDRRDVGLERYDQYLQPNNGRDFLIDAYQESLDLTAYLRGLVEETKGVRQSPSDEEYRAVYRESLLFTMLLRSLLARREGELDVESREPRAKKTEPAPQPVPENDSEVETESSMAYSDQE